MDSFRYRAVTAAGALRAGVMEAQGEGELRDQLRRQGLTAIEAVRVKAEGARRLKPVKPAVLARLLGELAVMLDAGIPLDRALAAAAENVDEAGDRRVLERLLAAVREGRPLSQAMADLGEAIPPMASAMALAGETNGRPAAALADAAQALERAEALRSALRSAAVYPAMLIAIALGVIALMLFWVVPQFETLFSEGGPALPQTTRVVLAISHGARRYGAAIAVALLVVGLLAAPALKRPAVRRWTDAAALRLPRLGELVRRWEAARFTRVLASLASGGVPLPDALAIAGRSIANSRMRAQVEAVTTGVRRGEGLAEPLAASRALPRLADAYLRIGEQSAELPLMLGRLADVLDKDVRTQSERLVAVLTPLITVLMGAVVATVVASIMTAIIGFNDLALG